MTQETKQRNPNKVFKPNPIAKAAREYLQRGWKPVPIPHQRKNPTDKKWQNTEVNPEHIHALFTRWNNIGVQFGGVSNGLCDVDLDCNEAIELAELLLPPTDAVFGRASKPRSHWLYQTDLYKTEQKANIKYTEPTALARKGAKPATLVELRIGAGGLGAQSLFPPSTHPSGEQVKWDVDGEPAQFDGAELKRRVTGLTVAALLVREYPPEGVRHDGALVLGGMLARMQPNMSAGQIEALVSAIARVARDEEWEERGRSAAGAVALLQSNQPTPGVPRMREVWGVDVTDTIIKWFGGSSPQKYSDDDDAVIDELAKLSAFEYDRRRDEEAKRLKVRVTTLDNEVAKRKDDLEYEEVTEGFLQPVEPWPEPVDGHDLLSDICDVLESHVILPKGCSTAIALWILHAHCIDAAEHSPILDISSPTIRCGKTQTLEVVWRLVPKPMPAANVTPATIFRAIDFWHPTMLIDEVETFISDKSELRGVLNSGHTRALAFVLRCVGEDQIPKQFSTWCAKVFAHTGRMHASLVDRSIGLGLKRKLKEEKVNKLPKDPDAYRDLLRKCARFAIDNMDKLLKATPQIPEELNDRAADNWEPLLAIAEVCSEDWAKEARAVAVQLSGENEDETQGVELLRDLRTIFIQTKLDRMFSEGIPDELVKMEGHSWAEFSKDGRPITTTQVAALLKPFKIKPKQIKIGTKRKNGYMRKQFEWAFKRYLPRQGGGSPAL